MPERRLVYLIVVENGFAEAINASTRVGNLFNEEEALKHLQEILETEKPSISSLNEKQILRWWKNGKRVVIVY